MTPDYTTWTRAALIARIIELEDKYQSVHAESIVSRLPVSLGPGTRALLVELINAYPGFVCPDQFIEIGASKNVHTLRVLIRYLRVKLGPAGVKIKTKYHEGYRLVSMEPLLALITNPGLANSGPRRASGGRFYTGLEKEPVDVQNGS